MHRLFYSVQSDAVEPVITVTREEASAIALDYKRDGETGIRVHIVEVHNPVSLSNQHFRFYDMTKNKMTIVCQISPPEPSK
jgi:hypothetical protein